METYTVNISKTKNDVFCKGRQPKYVFTYNGLHVLVELVKDAHFLGVIFSSLRTDSIF